MPPHHHQKRHRERPVIGCAPTQKGAGPHHAARASLPPASVAPLGSLPPPACPSPARSAPPGGENSRKARNVGAHGSTASKLRRQLECNDQDDAHPRLRAIRTPPPQNVPPRRSILWHRPVARAARRGAPWSLCVGRIDRTAHAHKRKGAGRVKVKVAPKSVVLFVRRRSPDASLGRPFPLQATARARHDGSNPSHS